MVPKEAPWEVSSCEAPQSNSPCYLESGQRWGWVGTNDAAKRRLTMVASWQHQEVVAKVKKVEEDLHKGQQ